MPSKKRIPDKCKLWEKERRNRFNAAVDDLNLLVNKEKAKTNNGNGNQQETSNIERLSKIEIILRAIDFIKFLVHSKEDIEKELSQLKQLKEHAKKNDLVDPLIAKGMQSKTDVPEQQGQKTGKRKHFKKIQKLPNKKTCFKPKKSRSKMHKTVYKLPTLLPKGAPKPVLFSTLVMPSPILLPTTPYMILPQLSMKKNAVATLPRQPLRTITMTTMVNKVPIPSTAIIKPKKAECTLAVTKVNYDPAPKQANKDKDTIVNETAPHNEDVKKGEKSRELDKILLNENCSSSKSKTVVKNDPVPGVKSSQDVDIPCANSIKHDFTSKINETLAKKDDVIAKNLPLPLNHGDCENADGGNARLEFAEELLASSPTAAFLMSFPLVSGPRADSPELQNDHHQVQRNVSTAGIDQTKYTMPESRKPKAQERFFGLKYSKETTKEKNPKSLNEKKTTEAKFSLPNINTFSNCSLNANSTSTAHEPFNAFNFDFCKNSNQSMDAKSYCPSTTKVLATKIPHSIPNGNTTWAQPDPTLNTFSFYPCAMEKNPRISSETEYRGGFDELMLKSTSLKLGYDLESNNPLKSYDMSASGSAISVNFPNVSSAPPSTSYNIFNSDFQLPFVSFASNTYSKSSGFNDAGATYSQPSTLGSGEAVSFKDMNNVRKSKQLSFNSNYHCNESYYDPIKGKINNSNFQNKTSNEPKYKRPNFDVAHLVMDKNSTNKKSPKKNHVNWMTSESRPVQSYDYDYRVDIKNAPRLNLRATKQDYIDPSFLNTPIPNLPTVLNQDEAYQQMWPNNRHLQVGESNMEPCSINIPSLNVGDVPYSDSRKNEQLPNNLFKVPQLTSEKSVEAMPSWMIRSFAKNNKNQSHKSKDNNLTLEKQDCVSSNFLYSSYCYDTELKGYATNYEYTDIGLQNNQQSEKQTKQTEKYDNPTKQNPYYYTESLIKKDPAISKCLNVNKFLDLPKVGEDQNQSNRVPHLNAISEYSENSYIQPFIYNTAPTISSNNFYPNYISTNNNIMTNYTPSNFSTDLTDTACGAVNNFDATDNCYKNKPLDTFVFNKDYYDRSAIKIPVPPDINTRHRDKVDSVRKNNNKRQKTNHQFGHTESHFYKSLINSDSNQESKNSDNTSYPYSHNLNCPSTHVNTNRTNFHLSNLFPEIAKIKQ